MNSGGAARRPRVLHARAAPRSRWPLRQVPRARRAAGCARAPPAARAGPVRRRSGRARPGGGRARPGSAVRRSCGRARWRPRRGRPQSCWTGTRTPPAPSPSTCPGTASRSCAGGTARAESVQRARPAHGRGRHGVRVLAYELRANPARSGRRARRERARVQRRWGARGARLRGFRGAGDLESVQHGAPWAPSKGARERLTDTSLALHMGKQARPGPRRCLEAVPRRCSAHRKMHAPLCTTACTITLHNIHEPWQFF